MTQTTMTDTERPTAIIYQFPTGTSLQVSASRVEASRSRAVSPVYGAVTACGDGWYHDAAIHDAETPYR